VININFKEVTRFYSMSMLIYIMTKTYLNKKNS